MNRSCLNLTDIMFHFITVITTTSSTQGTTGTNQVTGSTPHGTTTVVGTTTAGPTSFETTEGTNLITTTGRLI